MRETFNVLSVDDFLCNGHCLRLAWPSMPLLAALLLLASLPLAFPQSYVWPTVTLTGQGAANPVGAVNGLPAAASFNSPRGLCMARSPNASAAASSLLYVMDRSNNQLRAVNVTSGLTSLFAGDPGAAAGSANGGGTAASFNWPFACSVSADGSYMVVADWTTSALRRVVLASASVTHLVPTTLTAVGGLAGVALRSDGAVYVGESVPNRVRLYFPSNATVVTVAGNGTAGQASGAAGTGMLNYPRHISLVEPLGLLYIADTNNNALRVLATTTGQLSTLAGACPVAAQGTPGVCTSGWRDGAGTQAQFSSPFGVFFDSGHVWVAELSHTIRRVRASDGFTVTIAGTPSTAGLVDGWSSQYNAPVMLAQAYPLGPLYVSDFGNSAVRTLNAQLCPAGHACADAAATLRPNQPFSFQWPLLQPQLCPAGSFCPLGSTTPTPCPGSATTLYPGAASAAACIYAPPPPSSSAAANCSALGLQPTLPSQLIALPNVTDAAPLLFLPAASPLNAQGQDLVLATAQACAAYAALVGSPTRCDMARLFPIPSASSSSSSSPAAAYYYLGLASDLGMAASSPSCGV